MQGAARHTVGKHSWKDTQLAAKTGKDMCTHSKTFPLVSIHCSLKMSEEAGSRAEPWDGSW